MRHKKFKLSVMLLFGFGLIGLQAQTTGTFTDSRDGKVYKTVKIGEQVWMAENLAYKPTSGNFWAYDNKTDNIVVYGYLYDWQTAMNVCPTGWHLPSDAEWTQLTDFLGGKSVAGDKLKEIGTTHWDGSNTGATNETRFTGLPGGARHSNGVFYGIGFYGDFWSATEDDATRAWSRFLAYKRGIVYRKNNDKKVGYCVRCLKD